MTPVASGLEITVSDNADLHRYELLVGGQLAALASYVREPGSIVFIYTELMAGFEGRGLGQRLAHGALSEIRDQRLIVTPRCAFMSTYIEDHREFAELLGPSYESLSRS
jgi:predicted GNAT family acetyltransferase